MVSWSQVGRIVGFRIPLVGWRSRSLNWKDMKGTKGMKEGNDHGNPSSDDAD
jgi:hypothetical protein